MTYNVTIRPPPEQIDVSSYTPNEIAERYHAQQFEALDQNYYINVGTSRGAPVLIVGLILFLHIAIWNCASCCCCKARELSRFWKLFTTVLILAATFGGVVCLSLLLANGSDQDNLVKKLPHILDYLVWGFEDTVDTIQRAIFQSGDCASSTDSAISELYDATQSIISQIYTFVPTGVYDPTSLNQSISSTYVSTEEAFRALDETLDGLSGDINTTDVFFTDDIKDAILDFNDTRNTVFLAFTIVILGLMLLQVLVSMMNLWAAPSLKPRKCCWACLPITTCAFLLAFIVVWILATVLILLTTIMADFCVAPDQNIYELQDNFQGESDDSGSSSGFRVNDTLNYYMRCDEMNVSNPLKPDLDLVADELQNGTERLIEFQAEANICPQLNFNFTDYNISCDPLTELSSDIVTQCSLVTKYIAGRSNGPNGPFDEGTVFGQTECAPINSRYQAILHIACDDLLKIFATGFEAFIALGVLMWVIEVLRKFSRGRDEDDESSKTVSDVEAQKEEMEMDAL